MANQTEESEPVDTPYDWRDEAIEIIKQLPESAAVDCLDLLQDIKNMHRAGVNSDEVYE